MKIKAYHSLLYVLVCYVIYVILLIYTKNAVLLLPAFIGITTCGFKYIDTRYLKQLEKKIRNKNRVD